MQSRTQSLRAKELEDSGYEIGLHACGSVRVLFHTAYLVGNTRARTIVILIRVSCHLFSIKRQINGAVSDRLPITLL